MSDIINNGNCAKSISKEDLVKKKNNIEKILKIKNVNDKLLDYFYTDKDVYCCPTNLEPMFNINKFDYLKPIKLLSEYYSEGTHNYYKDLYEKNKNIKAVKYNDYEDHNEIILQYVKCFKNMLILVVWNTEIIPPEFMNYLKENDTNGIIHGVKTLTLNKKQIEGVIFQLYYYSPKYKNYDKIKNKANKVSNSTNIHIIFYESTDPIKFNERNSEKKKKLREILKGTSLTLTGTSLTSTGGSKEHKLNDYMYSTCNFTHTVEVAELLCNENSLQMLKYQRIDRLLTDKNYPSYVLIMTIKNWIYKNILLVDQIRFMLTGSSLLYSLGTRKIKDIDLLVYHIPEKTETIDFDQKMNYYFRNNKTKFPLVDYAQKGYGEWVVGGKKDYASVWYETKWPMLYGSKSIHETFLNPKFYYYYFGIKMISIDADIARRIVRGRAAAYADLLSLIKINNMKIVIPPIPASYRKDGVVTKYTDTEINQLYKRIQTYLKTKYNVNVSLTSIMNMIKKE